MRHTIVVVAMLFIMVAGDIAPAQSTSTSSIFGGIPIYIKGEAKSPAGRIEIYFTNERDGEKQFWYTGSSREIQVSAGIPAFSWCVAKIRLTGDYADQVVESEWENLGEEKNNTFYCKVTPGDHNAVFYIEGKKKKFLCVPFLQIPIGSSSFTTEQSFRVHCRNDLIGFTSYEARLQVARMLYPSARYYELREPGNGRFVHKGDEGVNPQRVVDNHELYATLYVYERDYQPQGMVIAGSEELPCNDSTSLRDVMAAYQYCYESKLQAANQATAEAEYQRQLDEANAARQAAESQRAADAAEYQRKLAETEAARKVAEERLANPPAPVTKTTTETTTEAVQPRPEASVARVSFRINLPPAGVVTRVETLDERGSRVYDRRYAGYIPMNNYLSGATFCVRLTWEGASAPDPWKVVRKISDGLAVDYSSLEVR